jgi:hypothetical protein
MEPVVNSLRYKARSILILGVKRTGKSTLAARLIYTHPAQLILIYDSEGGEFSKRLGAKLATSRDDFLAMVESGERLCCYDAEAGEDDPKKAGLAWFCEVVFEVGGRVPGRKLAIIDELQNKIDPWNMPEYLDELLTRGGRREIDTCLIGSAPNALQCKARNQVSELYCFRLIDETAIQFPKQLKIDPASIRTLPDCRFIFLDMRTGQKEELDLWEKSSGE